MQNNLHPQDFFTKPDISFGLQATPGKSIKFVFCLSSLQRCDLSAVSPSPYQGSCCYILHVIFTVAVHWQEASYGNHSFYLSPEEEFNEVVSILFMIPLPFLSENQKCEVDGLWQQSYACCAMHKPSTNINPMNINKIWHSTMNFNLFILTQANFILATHLQR